MSANIIFNSSSPLCPCLCLYVSVLILSKYHRNPSHIYELRSYHLRPGTMVEWGNYWARAIKLRDYQHSEAYMGLFSQIGELYNVKVGSKSDI